MSNTLKTMKCHEAQKLLPPYADGTLAGQAQASTSQHLASCPACRLRLEELKADLALLRSTPPPEPGPYFAARVMADVRQVDRAPDRAWRAWGKALSSAAATLLVVAGLGAGAIIGRGLAQGRSTSTSAEELTVTSDEPAFADAFETALTGD